MCPIACHIIGSTCFPPKMILYNTRHFYPHSALIRYEYFNSKRSGVVLPILSMDAGHARGMQRRAHFTTTLMAWDDDDSINPSNNSTESHPLILPIRPFFRNGNQESSSSYWVKKVVTRRHPRSAPTIYHPVVEEHPIADDDAPLPCPVYAETDMSSSHLDRVIEDIMKTVSDSARMLDPSLAYVIATSGDMPFFWTLQGIFLLRVEIPSSLLIRRGAHPA